MPECPLRDMTWVNNERMSSNLSICTGFRLFRNSNLLIVILSLTCIYICCAFAGDSYEESKPGNDKPKSGISGSYVMLSQRMSTFGLQWTRG